MGDFWNPRRMRNFMVQLGMKPTKFSENMQMLSKHLRITVEELTNTNPIEIGKKCWFPEHTIRYLLGWSEFDRLSTYPSCIHVAPIAPIVPIIGVSPEDAMWAHLIIDPSLEQRVRQLEVSSLTMVARIEELEKHTAAVALLYMQKS